MMQMPVLKYWRISGMTESHILQQETNYDLAVMVAQIHHPSV